MPQKTSPFLEGKWGWNFGESGWNSGADENWLKFSYMFDANVDAIVSTLPAAVNGEAYFLTTDNRIYFVVDGTYYSTPIPKWFEFKIKSTGVVYQFNGATASIIPDTNGLNARVTALENDFSTLGSAAFEDSGSFATPSYVDQSKAWLRTALVGEITTIQDALDADTYSIWEYADAVTEKPDAFDPNTWDWTPAFQAVSDAGGTVRIPSGIFILTSVTLTKNIHFICEEGTIFKRKSGTDVRQSYWNPGTAVFEIRSIGVHSKFSGGPTFDGNNTNQLGRYQEPSGFAVKVQPPTTVVSSDNVTILVIEGAKFINGTSGYLQLRGDDVNRRYLTKVLLDDCSFYDTLHGTGKGDPSAINPLGYQPDYITCLDYVTLISNNTTMEFIQDCPLGFYAPCGIRGTYAGAGEATSGKCSVFLTGQTKTKGLGRDARAYNNATDFVTNNGIGVIDMYGNAEELYISNLLGYSNRNVTMRAKASISRFTLLNGTLDNCWRGVQVSPSTTGAAEALVYIGNLNTKSGTIPQLEVVGTTATDRVVSCSIGSAVVTSAVSNPEGLTLNGAIRFRNVSTLSAASLKVFGAETQGLTVVDVVRSSITQYISNSTTAQSLYIAGTQNGIVTISAVDIRNAGLDGVSIASGTTGDIQFIGGFISTVVGNGVFNNSTSCTLMCQALHVDNVSGTSRGFYSAAPRTVLVNNSTTATTTPVGGPAGSRRQELGNSWNPNITYDTAAPTSGTWSRGDIVYNTAPSASGTVGWVCTTAGTPGTWKTFGTIAA